MNIITPDSSAADSADAIIEACKKTRINESGIPVQIERGSVTAEFPDAFVALIAEETQAHKTLMAFIETNPHTFVLSFTAKADPDLLDLQNSTFIGTRDGVKSRTSRILSMQHITREETQSVSDGLMEYAHSFPQFHLHIDLSVLDPIFFPELSSPCPAGMTVRELVYFIQRICLLRNFKTCTITGWQEPLCNQSIATLSKIVCELQKQEKPYEDYE